MNLKTEIYKNREPVNNNEGYLALNPDKAKLLEMTKETWKKGGLVIVEVGFGEAGGISLEKNDLYIGVEPNFQGQISFKVNKAERGARVVVLDDSMKLPQFRPDLLLCLAPNPNDIDDDMLFEYEGIISNKLVPVVIVTDGRTREANSGEGLVAFGEKVINDLKDMGKGRKVAFGMASGGISDLLDDLGVERSSHFEASNDLGEEAFVVWSRAR